MTSPMPPSFSITRWKPGYAVDQVDAFLATIASRTAEEINAVEFHTTRLKGGYDEQEVDAYLDSCIAHKRRAQQRS
jgi:DivIVA domain-containing protein